MQGIVTVFIALRPLARAGILLFGIVAITERLAGHRSRSRPPRVDRGRLPFLCLYFRRCARWLFHSSIIHWRHFRRARCRLSDTASCGRGCRFIFFPHLFFFSRCFDPTRSLLRRLNANLWLGQRQIDFLSGFLSMLRLARTARGTE